MRRATLIFLLISSFLIFLLLKSCCDQYPISEKDLKWWKSWKEGDTLYYKCLQTDAVDTLIVEKSTLYQPQIGGFFSLRGFSVETNDAGQAYIRCVIKHNSKEYDISYYQRAYRDKSTMGLEFQFGLSRSVSLNEVDTNVVRLNYQEIEYDADYHVDFVTIHRDSALTAYSLDGLEYRRIN